MNKQFKKEYHDEIAEKVAPLDNPEGPKISAFAERMSAAKTAGLPKGLVESMAMRDLAILTAITNTEDWGDHEMIVMGDKHVETLGPAIRERAGLEVISRTEFASAEYSDPAL
ncbi:MAG TPA: hypothetical protein VF798_10450 [Burkholderiaceae bacterium]